MLNLDYDKQAKQFRPAQKVALRVPASLLPAGAQRATLLSYDGAGTEVPLTREGEFVNLELPSLRLWTIVAVDAPK